MFYCSTRSSSPRYFLVSPWNSVSVSYSHHRHLRAAASSSSSSSKAAAADGTMATGIERRERESKR